MRQIKKNILRANPLIWCGTGIGTGAAAPHLPYSLGYVLLAVVFLAALWAATKHAKVIGWSHQFAWEMGVRNALQQIARHPEAGDHIGAYQAVEELMQNHAKQPLRPDKQSLS